MFCGRHLLTAKPRLADIDATTGSADEIERIVRRIRARWPCVRILLSGGAGFAPEVLMAWCEVNCINYLFGLAHDARLVGEIEAEMAHPSA